MRRAAYATLTIWPHWPGPGRPVSCWHRPCTTADSVALSLTLFMLLIPRPQPVAPGRESQRRIGKPSQQRLAALAMPGFQIGAAVLAPCLWRFVQGLLDLFGQEIDELF